MIRLEFFHSIAIFFTFFYFFFVFTKSSFIFAAYFCVLITFGTIFAERERERERELTSQYPSRVRGNPF
jgi:Ca2+-dependent lipid-binding protein